MRRIVIMATLLLILVSSTSSVHDVWAQSSVALRINAGGGDYTDTNGDLFVADKEFTAGDFGYTGGQTSTATGEIAGTDDDPLFQSQRTANTFSYTFDNLPADDYAVTFYFVETKANGANKRNFDVTIEGVIALDDYDIFATAGGSFIAVTETVVTNVSDGQLNIDFSSNIQKPLISAIAVVSTTPPTPEPDINATPLALDYGDVEINTTADLDVTVSNVGTADLTVSGLATTNGVFTVEGPATPVIVTPGNSVLVTVRFSPTAAGVQNGDLQITSDDPDEGIVTVSLTGNGSQPPPNDPDISVNPTSLSYGQVTVGNTVDQVVTVSNDGLQTLSVTDLTTTNGTFTVVSPAVPFDVAPSALQDVTVRFSPTAEQVENGDLQITSNDPDEGLVTVPLSGEGVTTPPVVFRINAGGSDFTDINGDLFVADKAYVAGDFGYSGGSSKIYTGDVAGTTDDDLYLNVRLGNPSFNYLFDNVPSGTYDITFYFTEPTANSAGQRTFDVTIEGVLTLDDYDIFATAGGKLIAVTETVNVAVSDGQLNIDFSSDLKPAVSAIAVVSSGPSTPTPDINATPLALDYGDVEINTTADLDVTVSNVGTADLTVSGLATTNGVFTVEGPATPVIVTPGNSVLVTVRFSPTAAGVQNGDLQITSDDPDEGIVTVSLTGNGSQPPPNDPDISVNPTSLSYGQVTVGNTVDQVVTVSNDGLQTLSVTDLTTTNGTFTVVSPAVPFDVAPSALQDVTVRFSPTAEQVENGDLQITSNDPDEGLVTVPLSGEGVTTPPVVFRINAGGSDFTDINGDLFVADKAYVAGDFGYSGGSSKIYTGDVAGTTDDDLYLNVRLGNPSFNYLFDNVPSGTYQITLYFVETSANSAGQRLMDVSVEGVIVLSSYDIFTNAGGNMIAHNEIIIADVTDGQLDIAFTGNTKPIVSAIAVTPAANEPNISVSPAILNFGPVATGNSVAKLLSVSNTGLETLTVSNINSTNSVFTVDNPTGAFDVLPGESQLVTIGFAPTVLGTQTGDLEITSNDPDEGLTIVPVTGEGVVDTPGTYIDVAGDVGLVLSHGLSDPCAPDLDTPIGSGSAWADYDNDGDIDLFVTNRSGSNRLYRNDGDTDSDGLPNYTDVAAAVGVDDPTGLGHSSVFIDYDNDGDQDLYVTNWGGNILFENQLIETSTVSFIDVTATAGLQDWGRAITTAWADFDQDGYLDVYVSKHKNCMIPDPVASQSEDHLYHSNGPDANGDVTFTDVTDWLCGPGLFVCNQTDAYSFAAGWFDYDNDGDLDLYNVIDRLDDRFDYNTLWRNDGSDGAGGWIFTDVSTAAGVDLSVHAMGLGVGDYDNDGNYDVAFSDVGPAELLHNEGDGTFTDVGVSSGVSTITGEVTWGTVFFDHDNDTLLDLYIVAGWLMETPAPLSNFFLGNQGDGTFVDLSFQSGLNDIGRARSASIVDFDEDGFVDVFVGNLGEAPRLFHNRSILLGNTNHGLTVTVEGTESNRDGIGTRLYLTAGGVTMMRDITSGPTHGGGDYRAAYFGLGAETSGTLEVHWPNGVVENLGTVTADQQLHLIEPASAGDPDIAVSPASLNFGQVVAGTTADQIVTVSNVGAATLTVSDLTTTNGVFTIVSPATPFDVAPSGSQDVTVRFSPTVVQTENGDLQISSNDPDAGLVIVPLSGEGVSAITTYIDVAGDVGLVLSHETDPSICDPALGSGSAWADYDNDGDIDLFVTNHGGANHLYRNDGDTNSDGLPDFTDVAAAMGVDDPTGVGHGAVFVDYDNDGDQDLYVSNWGDGTEENILYQNQLIETSSVSFVDVTLAAGLNDNGRGITAAWADFDNDGFLDLYTAKYQKCFGDPESTNHLYHNQGDGTFVDVTSYLCGGAATCAPNDGYSFTAGWFDYDNDNDQDLYLVNDKVGGGAADSALWRNDGSDGAGGWTFTDVSVSSGANYGVNAMGLGVGDYDNDGDFDFAFSDIGPGHLAHNNGDGTFTEVSDSAGVTAATDSPATWGTAFFDYDNDGWVDLFFVAGGTGGPDNTPNFLLHNQADGTFSDVSVSSGVNHTGRGRNGSMVDLDSDGFVDLFVHHYGEAPILLHNRASQQGNTNHWLSITVEGTESNRDGIGARLILTAGGVTQMREISSGPTHGGGDYRAAYFGLGAETSGTLEVHWPNGVVENLGTVTGDQQLHLVEPPSAPPATTYIDVAGDVGLVLSHETDPSICDPALGSGSAWADYDNDGDIDLFVTNHGGANHLYRNDGDTNSDGLPDFTDVAAAMGVDDPTGVGHGAVFVDYDNDGDQDLYVSNWGDGTEENILYQNQLIETSSVSFVDVTLAAGLNDNGRGITAAWADFDNDGFLDLYTAKYQKCFGDPESTNHLYHNQGDGTFVDVTSYLCGGAATCAPNDGYSFTAGWFDYDNDNDQDLYLVNDKVGGGAADSALWRNDGSDGAGGWTFTDVSVSSGANYGVNAMGLGVGDYDNDGDFDFAFSDIGPGHLAHNNGDGTFTEVSDSAGVTAATDSPATWGTAFFDYDNDGWVDLFFVAGGTGGPDNTPNFLLHNQADGTFSDVSVSSGVNHTGRGRNGSMVDLDNDGFVDLFVHHYGEAPILLHNRASQQGNTNHWLSITVEGTESNRDGIGARLILTAGGVTQMREISSGPTHGGGDYRAAYFGLGAETSGTLEVHWPNGVVENLGTVTGDQQLHLVEPPSSN